MNERYSPRVTICALAVLAALIGSCATGAGRGSAGNSRHHGDCGPGRRGRNSGRRRHRRHDRALRTGRRDHYCAVDRSYADCHRSPATDGAFRLPAPRFVDGRDRLYSSYVVAIRDDGGVRPVGGPHFAGALVGATASWGAHFQVDDVGYLS